MGWSKLPKYAEVDVDAPVRWQTCMRCGRIYNADKLVWQYDYRGSPILQNTRIMVCTTNCYDVPQVQLAPYILPPDPPPTFNAFPEQYALDEDSYLSTAGSTPFTLDGDILVTAGGDPITPNQPNPADDPQTCILVCSISAPSGSVAVAYLDLFNGNPTTSLGRSVLSTITGSTTRTNIASDLTTTAGIATNLDTLVVSSSIVTAANVSYVGLYNAATGGTLLMSGPLSSSPTLVAGYVLQFNALGLSIDLN